MADRLVHAPALAAVITTVAPPTPSVRALAARLEGCGRLFIVGDRKGPPAYDCTGTVFLSLADQRRSGFGLASLLPECHYTRKNIGYLSSIASGATCIYETDDDNAPLPAWGIRSERVGTCRQTPPAAPPRWVNAYGFFTRGLIWPRGLPLDAIREPIPEAHPSDTPLWAPVQQGLANGSPDVDAVWRLTMDRTVVFDGAPSLHLGAGNWCPFNSQSTWWWPAAFPLMYLPSRCSFRMCDIWRSFVAQRCLWAMGAGVVFHGPEVEQDRNVHDLMRDFRDEVPGYTHNRAIAAALDVVALESGPESAGTNLARCYRALVDAQVLPGDELALVDAWLDDCRQAWETCA